jgi:hypothetical protein
VSTKYPELKTAEGWRTRATQMHREALMLKPGIAKDVALKLAFRLSEAADLLGVLSPGHSGATRLGGRIRSRN